MQKRQKIVEKNYLEVIFDDNDYESPEEKAIQSIEQLPNDNLNTKTPSRRKGIRYEEISS